MYAIVHAEPAAALAPARRAPAPLRIFLLEAHSEFLRLLRAPAFVVPTIAFPLLFYVLFGVLLGPVHSDPEAARRALASFVVLGTMAPGLFAIGVTLALDRENGLLELKRALPMPRGAYLAAKIAMAMLFAVIVSLLLMTTAAVVAKVVLTLADWGLLFVLAVLGVVPFCAIGLLVGALTRFSAAAAILNLIYLPMSFLSGLWVPLSLLPRVFAQLAPLWPSWHLTRIAFAAIGTGDSTGIAGHLLCLAAVTAACVGAARRALGRRR
jgi:ABC-2 type transport system permease protein